MTEQLEAIEGRIAQGRKYEHMGRQQLADSMAKACDDLDVLLDEVRLQRRCINFLAKQLRTRQPSIQETDVLLDEVRRLRMKVQAASGFWEAFVGDGNNQAPSFTDESAHDL